MFSKGIVSDNKIPRQEDFVRYSGQFMDSREGWKLISAATIMKDEYKKEYAKFSIVESYLAAIDELVGFSQNNMSDKKGLPIVNLNIITFRNTAIPFLFLCRQTVELLLKAALEFTNIPINGPTHNIKTLWSKFISGNKRYVEKDEEKYIQRISVLVDVLNTLDKDSMHFRYATSNDDKIYIKKPYFVYFKKFADEVHNMSVLFRFIDYRLFIKENK